jgi:hypothetical protein
MSQTGAPCPGRVKIVDTTGVTALVADIVERPDHA